MMKNFLKSLLRTAALLLVLPFVIIYKSFAQTRFGDSLFSTTGQLLSLVPGKAGSFLRVGFYSTALPEIANNIHIDFGTYLAHPEVAIAEKVYIGAYCIVGKCRIGTHTIIGSFVNILSGSKQHNFAISSQPIQNQGGEFQQIEIGANCWIGNNSVLMKNIGDSCVIGAGSVVTREIPAFSVAVGNPCRVKQETGKKESLS
jgi:virginiamycin A acetyltransferase